MTEKRILFVDIESYSSTNLIKCGMYAYAEAPDFELILIGYAFDDGPVTVVDLAGGEPFPDELRAALRDPETLKVAFNSNFERVTIGAYLGEYQPPEHWSCVSVMSRQLGLPGSLKDVCAVIGMDDDKAKMKSGAALIRYFCVPCKETLKNGGRVRNLPHHDPERWGLFKEYCARDVESEREIHKRLSKFPVIPSERALWILDQCVNDRGVRVGLTLARNAAAMDATVKGRLLEEAKELTGLENPRSNAQLKRWIEDVSGVAVDSLNKSKLAEVKEAAGHESVDEMLELRGGLAKSSTEKFNAMLRTVCKDGRVRGILQFQGAQRTGRWAGRNVQFHNLYRISMSEADLDVARGLVSRNDFETLEMLYGDVSETLAQLVRTAVIPAEGKKLVVADFSSIEARVLAWLANEEWKLEVFRGDGRIYETVAERMFGRPPGSIKKNDPLRQKGKAAELSCGYQGGAPALKDQSALESGLSDEELRTLVDQWRAANPKIVKFWRDLNTAAK